MGWAACPGNGQMQDADVVGVVAAAHVMSAYVMSGEACQRLGRGS